jgi:hypothetical protein
LAVSHGGYMAPSLFEEMKNWNSVAKRGTAWGEQQRGAGTTFMTFKDGQRACFVFRKEGPPTRSGYRWLIRGQHCGEAGAAMGASEINAFLNQVRLK